MWNFTMQNVRCFKGEQSLEIRPITLLVGENSTGKSTVLGCYHALNNAINQKIDFNIDPYHLGTFDDIIRQTKKTKKEFSLGINYDFHGQSIHYKIVVTKSTIEPIISKIVVTFDSGGSITFDSSTHHPFNDKKIKYKAGFYPDYIIKAKKDDFIIYSPLVDITTNSIGFILYRILKLDKPLDKNASILKKFLANKAKLTGNKNINPLDFCYSFMHLATEVESMSPMRSKPQRVYDPSNETLTPDGGGTPMLMRKLPHESNKEWELLHSQLINFGEKSGMFNDIQIRKFGENIGDPFQIQIQTGTRYTNIMDVGYGVSQLLPILVRILNKSFHHSSHFLLQQPEVHLHPQAQAALGTLLVELAKDGKGQNFIIETHSDFIVDRISTEIRDKKISPENVSLVYHEMKKGYVQLHNIGFDDMGNLINAPNGYRDFFTREINKVLGF